MSDKERMAYYNWLLGQAEKVMKSQQEIIEVNCAEYGQLQEKYKKAKEEIEFLKEELQQAQAKVERYEKALDHWNTYFDFSQPVPKDLNELGTQKGVQRCFDIARQALEVEK